MRVASNLSRTGVGFNMTPMIDVVFLLIIFFLVSSHLARQETQLELDLPTAASGREAAVESHPRLTVNVLADGHVMLGSTDAPRDEIARRLEYERRRTGDDLEVMVEVDDTGEREVSFEHSGPEVEVVVSRDTILYQDVTRYVPDDPAARKSSERTVQQVVKPIDSLEEIGQNAEMEVWGERRGDRIVAEVVVYRIVDF